MSTPERWTDAERREELDHAIGLKVRYGDCRVESQTDFQAILVQGRPVNHLLHFIAGIFTLGLWWLIWIVIAMTGGETRIVLTVDRYGVVHDSSVSPGHPSDVVGVA